MVEFPLGVVEAPTDRKGACDVACVEIEFRPSIDQYERVLFQHIAVFNIVQHAGIGPAAHDSAVGWPASPVPNKGVFQLGLELILIHSCLAGAHGANMGLSGNRRRMAQKRNFGGAFDQAHFVNQRAAIQPTLQRRFAPTHTRLSLSQRFFGNAQRVGVIQRRIEQLTTFEQRG